MRKDPDRQRRGRALQAVRESADPESRRITYRVQVADGFWDDPRNQLWLYTDETLTRLQPSPERGQVSTLYFGGDAPPKYKVET